MRENSVSFWFTQLLRKARNRFCIGVEYRLGAMAVRCQSILDATTPLITATADYTLVNDHARLCRARGRETIVPLAHPQGHAQLDFGEAAIAVQPSQCVLDNPTSWQDFKSIGRVGSLDDLNCPVSVNLERAAQFVPSVAPSAKTWRSHGKR